MRLRRPPLAVITIVSALLVLLPAGLLLRFPRRSASGLDRLIPSAALLQSFRAQAADPVPALWQQRLGVAEAQRLWPPQRGLWWQFWGAHGDAGAYLVLPASRSQALPAQAVSVDDLLVLAPDPLARQLLVEQLKVRRRPPRGLSQRCSLSLQQAPTVFWNAAALGQMLGPLAPLAQELEQGCLVLNGTGRTLRWQGEADASEAPLAPAPPPLAMPVAAPLSGDQLLELQGKRFALLLSGPLESGLLRQVLAQTYGLGPEQIRQLQALPFVLRLRSLPHGPFRAGLELELHPLAGRRQAAPALRDWLVQLSRVLQDQGLTQGAALPGMTAWSRDDGRLVGGWRWLADGRLLLFLGPLPMGGGAPQPALPEADWRLRMQPQAVAAAGLLPDSLPQVVQRARQLVLQGRARGARSGERLSALSGELSLP